MRNRLDLVGGPDRNLWEGVNGWWWVWQMDAAWPGRTRQRRLRGSAARRRAASDNLSSLRPRCRRGGGCRQRDPAAAARRAGRAARGPAGQLRGGAARAVPAGRAGRAAGRRAGSVGRRGRGGRGVGPFGCARGSPAALGRQLPPGLIVQHLEHVRLRGASAQPLNTASGRSQHEGVWLAASAPASTQLCNTLRLMQLRPSVQARPGLAGRCWGGALAALRVMQCATGVRR